MEIEEAILLAQKNSRSPADLLTLSQACIREKKYESGYIIARLAENHLRSEESQRKNAGLYQILSVCSFFLSRPLESLYWLEHSKRIHNTTEQTKDEGVIQQKIDEKLKKPSIRVLCNWDSPDGLQNGWRRMLTENGPFEWSNQESADYTVIVNATNVSHDPPQSIVFRMEPHMERAPQLWGNWARPKSLKYLHFQTHEVESNLGEWWLDLTHQQLQELDWKSLKSKDISAVVSNKYVDPGHKLRIDFLKYVEEQNVEIDIYGLCDQMGFRQYRGPLPTRDKNKGILSYKYIIAVENQSIPNYFTEKVIDGLLGGCLVFYWGCPNIQEYFGEAVIPINFSNKEKALEQIRSYMEGQEWDKRHEAIEKARQRLLNALTFQPRIGAIVYQAELKKHFGPGVSHAFKLSQQFGAIRCENELQPVMQYLGIRTADQGNAPGVWRKVPKLVRTSPSYQVGEYTFVWDKRKPEEYQLPLARVVNMDRRPDRWETFRRHVPIDLPHTRFSAVDGGELKRNKELQHLFRDNDFGFRQGVVGCAMSHLTLWRQLLNSGQDYMLILEDDVEFAPNFSLKLEVALQNAPALWDLLFIGHTLLEEHITDHRDPDQLPVWEDMLKYSVPHRTSWVGTFGYLISKEGARTLVDFIDTNGIQHGVDYLMQLRFPEMSAYGCRPMLVYSEYVQPGKQVDTDIQFNSKTVGE